MTRALAESYLRQSLNASDVTLREGQWEAIQALVEERKKLLVVQRTGWGKSSVYFISTKLLREKGYGPTVIISPLLALMRNQLDAADRLGVSAVTLNSSNKAAWEEISHQIASNTVDCLLISPERLSNEDFYNDLFMSIAERIGLMVVDEAHCISDWGHDFRPDYRRILNILKRMPANMPVLATTATANDRVIEDITSQLGDLEVQRGPLARDSLALQTVTGLDSAERLVWLSQVIKKQLGSGIVYVLTKRDAQQVSEWLGQQGIESAAYYSGVEKNGFDDSNQYREHLEERLSSNALKALVATTALGMGYDKPDLSFVIHFQAPSSIVSYYQQVGRAGRGIGYAAGVLLSGCEDEKIHAFFRRSAFPTETQVKAVLAALDKFDGLTWRGLEEVINLPKGKIEKVLKLLSVENPSPVFREGNRWYRTSVPFRMDHERIERLTNQREIEWQQVQDYLRYDGCLMDYLRRALDDPHLGVCGKCANCTDKSIVEAGTDQRRLMEASLFLRHAEFPLTLKTQVAANAFPLYGFKGNLPRELKAETGRVLSRWGDSVWGELVETGKAQGHFSDELVNAMAEMIEQRWNREHEPVWMCAVPSLVHQDLVRDFAVRLGQRLGLNFYDVVAKRFQNEQQKYQQNRFHQCKNLDGVFSVDPGLPEGPVFLLDDVVDSGWTMTVIAALLKKQGVSYVYPIALASSATGN